MNINDYDVTLAVKLVPKSHSAKKQQPAGANLAAQDADAAALTPFQIAMLLMIAQKGTATDVVVNDLAGGLSCFHGNLLVTSSAPSLVDYKDGAYFLRPGALESLVKLVG